MLHRLIFFGGWALTGRRPTSTRRGTAVRTRGARFPRARGRPSAQALRATAEPVRHGDPPGITVAAPSASSACPEPTESRPRACWRRAGGTRAQPGPPSQLVVPQVKLRQAREVAEFNSMLVRPGSFSKAGTFPTRFMQQHCTKIAARVSPSPLLSMTSHQAAINPSFPVDCSRLWP